MSKSTKVPTVREAAERRILARQGAKLDASCDHLVEAARVLLGADPHISATATLAAHIVSGETDINRVAQVAVRLAWRLARTEGELIRQQNTVRELRQEISDECAGC